MWGGITSAVSGGVSRVMGAIGSLPGRIRGMAGSVLSAALERSCHAEEFYQGAYVERSEDGQLCARRERLQSRTGSSCQVAKLSRLVARK